MKTEILKIEDFNNKNLFNKLKEAYLENKLVAIPTETVYGLSADATSEEAVKKIYLAKGRPSDNPLIVHFHNVNQLKGIVYFEEDNIEKLINNFWPGPMTLILKLVDDKVIAPSVRANLSTLAVRMPSNKVARKILEETNILLAAPSANTSGKPSPTRYEHVVNDLYGKIDIIIESEASTIGLESTVIDCTSYPFKILRPGSITKENIENVLGKDSIEYENVNEHTKTISPGMKYRHYSPEADLIIVDNDFENFLNGLKNKDKKTGFITYRKYSKKIADLNINIKYLADDEENIEESNKNLYNILREYDREQVEVIYILSMKENDKNKALINRIKKASSKK